MTLLARTALKDLYQKWLEHATVCFNVEDILTFLSRKLNGNFQGKFLATTSKNTGPERV